mmetsp:Transcript_2576/g.7876  ORF Transcript_2576/g.7876 Transcript_2576/m.7876 type:complete len:188 (+) Transcript_2576:163-726(+)
MQRTTDIHISNGRPSRGENQVTHKTRRGSLPIAKDPMVIDWTLYFRLLFRDVICDMSLDGLDDRVARYFDKSYVQHVDGKTLDYSGFVDHMRAQKSKLDADIAIRWQELHAYVTDEIDAARGLLNCVHVFSHHFVTFKMKGDGTTGQAEVVALFKLTREGKVFQCNELTKVMHGPADLGSIMDVTAA